MLEGFLISLRDRHWLRRAVLITAFISPLAVVGLVSRGLLPSGLLQTIAQPGEAASEAPGIITGLAGDMVGMAAGVIVAGWLIYRRDVVKRGRTAHAVLPLAISGLGLGAVFAGLRAKYAVAYVVSTQPFDLLLVSGFLEVQSVLLTLQVMTVALYGAHYAIYQDHRSANGRA